VGLKSQAFGSYHSIQSPKKDSAEVTQVHKMSIEDKKVEEGDFAAEDGKINP